MLWHVLGAGSIGGLWGAQLSLAGHSVRLILKDADALRLFAESPLSLDSAGEIACDAIDADSLSQEIEFLLVTTKSFATLDALERVRRWFSPSTVIVLLQNGIGMQQQVVESYPGLAVMAGVTTEGAYRRGPFQVVHAGRGKTRFGAISATPPARIAQLRRCFAGMPLEVEWVEDIWPAIWHKVAINCCINAPTALAQCRNGELVERAESRQQIEGLVREIQQVMQAAGCEFSFPDLYQEVLGVIAATAENYSSMCEDVRAGRRTEIENINGFICAQGEIAGVETPLNHALVEAILSLQTRPSSVG